MGFHIGIDIGGTRIKIGLVKDSNLFGSIVFGVEDKNNFEAISKEIDTSINELISTKDCSFDDLEGIGVSFPGIVDSTKKEVVATNHKYDGARDFDWKTWAESKYNCDLFLDNDARLACVGEWIYGSGKGVNNIVMMTLGTGIGTAVILEGKLLKGKHGQAGNLGGHLTIKHDGEICSCGNRGCVEAQASTDVLERILEEKDVNKQSKLSGLKKIEFHNVFQYASEGDEIAIEIRDYCLDIWASAVTTYIHAYDPELIIIGGGIMNSKDVILPYIENHIEKFAWTPWNDVKVIDASMLDNAAVLGATYMCKLNSKNKENVQIS